MTYVRCHDDIGWAVTEEDAAAVGEDGHLHRRFLSDFYAGEFPGTFARGARFQAEPQTGEARTSGTAASLAGPRGGARARRPAAEELAVRRILLLHAVAFAHGGLPLIYMGDELGLRNDRAYGDDAAHRDDNRWLHRPAMDWEAAGRRTDPATVEGRLWAGLRALATARRADPRGARPRPQRRRSGPATTTSSASRASTPATGCSCSPTSAPPRSRSTRAWHASTACARTRAATS